MIGLKFTFLNPPAKKHNMVDFEMIIHDKGNPI